MNIVELAGVVTKLHELARIVEAGIGVGEVSHSIRKSADNLYEIVKQEKYKAEQ